MALDFTKLLPLVLEHAAGILTYNSRPLTLSTSEIPLQAMQSEPPAGEPRHLGFAYSFSFYAQPGLKGLIHWAAHLLAAHLTQSLSSFTH